MNKNGSRFGGVMRYQWDFVLFIAAAFLTAASPSSANDVESFYKGKTIQIIVPAGPGGAFDLYSRLLSKHYQKYIPGNPNIILQYMPGAGGTRAANYMNAVAPKDGTVMCMPLAPIALAQLTGGSSIAYDASRFIWLGRLVEINRVLAVWHTAPQKTINDAFEKELVVASTGNNSETSMNAVVMNNLMGAKFKVVTGYKGIADMTLAMERNEVAGFFGSWGAWYGGRFDLITDKKVNLLIQIGTKRSNGLQNVPLMTDLTRSEADRQVVELMSRTSDVGHALFVPPDVPQDRVTALQKAFGEVIRDPLFLEEAKRLRLEINPATAEDVSKSVHATVSAPSEVVRRFIQVSGQ
ncbi:MAG: tripartite tricarboxylate transporter substrate-binding protein [Alphaproteobacteria bacterium]|nr:tripartite tricarboxylate transporter substrate-binding protein [Alphaproteobacteria bacterium]